MLRCSIAARLATSALRFVPWLQQVERAGDGEGNRGHRALSSRPLVSLNEVGGDPERPLGAAVGQFHERERRARCALAAHALATNTHDTKRSADVRARLDALSEIPRGVGARPSRAGGG